MNRLSRRRAAFALAAGVAALMLAWGIPAVRGPVLDLFWHPPVSAPAAAPDAATIEAAVTAAQGGTSAAHAPETAESAPPASGAPDSAQPAPSFGDVVINRDGTMQVAVRDCPESVALGVFLQVAGDASWYCKDAKLARTGDTFTARWRAEGTNDDRAEKIALFLYPKSEVHTTTSYALVEAASVASKVLTDLTR
jgi:hypothetical protein